ncbi:MAG: alkaline phosphatase [Muribaculaceae bacterium]
MAIAAYAAQPKYIFYFIGDGMGLGPVMATEQFNRQVLKNTDPILMLRFPIVSSAMTYSADAPVTDSAAAGTALSTGHKTRNGMLGMDADTVAVSSIAKYLKEKGYGIGITSTVPVDDATPGAFYAHQPNRSMYNEITSDMAASDYNFFAGSILRGDKEKTLKMLSDGGYSVFYGLDQLKASAPKDKTLLLGPAGITQYQCGYTIDSIAGALTLPQITQAAIDHLTRFTPKKFFLMVEGGNIDWCNHSNDGGTAIKEILNFNQAIALAYEFYRQHPKETLIVVTADHDTGGCSVGAGGKHADYSLIDYQRISKDNFSAKCKEMAKSGKDITWNEMKQILGNDFGLFGPIAVKEKEEKKLEEAFTEVFIKKDAEENKTLYNSYDYFVEAVFKFLDRKAGFGWTTNSHTGCLVPVCAVGVGAEKFGSLNNNIDIPRKIASLVGITMQ